MKDKETELNKLGFEMGMKGTYEEMKSWERVKDKKEN
jgi:hypothetical protein